jgi:hypothetical protein
MSERVLAGFIVKAFYGKHDKMLSYIIYFLYTDLQKWKAVVALKVAVKCWIHTHHRWQVTWRRKPGHAGVQKNQVAWSGMPQHLLLDVQKVIVMSLSRELCHYIVQGDVNENEVRN